MDRSESPRFLPTCGPVGPSKVKMPTTSDGFGSLFQARLMSESSLSPIRDPTVSTSPIACDTACDTDGDDTARCDTRKRRHHTRGDIHHPRGTRREPARGLAIADAG
ncbi:hypothetical protein CDD80_1794 [Ophiocordyceps camponoti-rufipedis]|uniref:Uncharacterized protein n=1 Tax=Ophiocordyceps camponoti-rufipedis TaxID=2004952 RepID=A0A2C5Z7Z2_9HYPO|nr:hypothetical protein CDD80_1794 [Ophiocordyceps camponoti-rufipedis]